MSRVCLVYPPETPDPMYQVWVGDCINPGKHVASAALLKDANRICVLLAMSMKVRAVPFHWDGQRQSVSSEKK